MVEFYTHFNFDKTLLEMAEVGRFDGFKITIYGSEGPIPHFHFENKDKTINGCLRLDKPEYFKHGKYQSKLNSKDKKRMIEWFQLPHKSFGKYGLNNWQVICIYWDDNNPDYPYDKDAPMPNYEDLK